MVSSRSWQVARTLWHTQPPPPSLIRNEDDVHFIIQTDLHVDESGGRLSL